MQGEGAMHSLGELLFSLALLVRACFQVLGLMPAPCEQPILYTIGTIDPRFGISEDEVKEAVQKAEAVWESASGKNLFEYSETSGLPVQFVYDERQQKTQAGQALEERLENLQVEKSEAAAEAQIRKYEQAKKEYESALASYERSADAYNDRVTRINKRGGATEAEQKDLREEYESLQEQFQAVEQSRQQVNSLAGTANQHIKTNQALVEAYNQEVTTFQEQYGGEGEVFDQGVYTGRDITVYQYDDSVRLAMVLAHELGHALGIEHVADSQALMFYLMKDQDVKNMALDDADRQALEAACRPPKFPWQT